MEKLSTTEHFFSPAEDHQQGSTPPEIPNKQLNPRILLQEAGKGNDEARLQILTPAALQDGGNPGYVHLKRLEYNQNKLASAGMLNVFKLTKESLHCFRSRGLRVQRLLPPIGSDGTTLDFWRIRLLDRDFNVVCNPDVLNELELKEKFKDFYDFPPVQGLLPYRTLSLLSLADLQEAVVLRALAEQKTKAESRSFPVLVSLSSIPFEQATA